MFAIKIIAAGLILALGIILWRRTTRNTRRKRLLAEPFKPQWREILQKNVPLYNRLLAELKTRLEGLINLFLAEKRFEGCRGQTRLGESWQNGPVVLAWNSVTSGAANINDGQNVVFHEFSHRLDQEDGSADGAPILENRGCYRSWAKVLSREYDVLRGKAKKYRPNHMEITLRRKIC